MKKLSKVLIAGSTFVPLFAFAQLGNVESIVRAIGRIIDLATPILVGLALLAFFWGLVRYIFSASDEDAKKEGVRLMVGGVIAIFVIVSIVGIIRWIGNALDIDQGGNLPVPGVQ